MENVSRRFERTNPSQRARLKINNAVPAIDFDLFCQRFETGAEVD
jgi:hypothetical protein